MSSDACVVPRRRIVFVGTGVSTAIPVMGHFGNCACRDAIANPKGPNRRNNVSLLIEIEESQQSPISGNAEQRRQARSILIDVGKTFRTAYFDCLERRGLRRIDTLLLTHDHADAIQGLDDVRDLQPFTEISAKEGWRCDYYVPTITSASTYRTLCQQVPYITKNSRLVGSVASPDWSVPYPRGGIIERRSTALDFLLVDEVTPQPMSALECLYGLPMYSVPLIHGPKYISMGFVFGAGISSSSSDKGCEKSSGNATPGGEEGLCVAYLSDVSEVPEATMAFLKSIRRIDILVVDLLLGPKREHFSHFCMDQALELAEALDANRVYGVGMFCELEHVATNQLLASILEERHAAGRMLGVRAFELAYDGLELPF